LEGTGTSLFFLGTMPLPVFLILMYSDGHVERYKLQSYRF
jgi:hypothetical protein